MAIRLLYGAQMFCITILACKSRKHWGGTVWLLACTILMPTRPAHVQMAASFCVLKQAAVAADLLHMLHIRALTLSIKVSNSRPASMRC